MSRFNLLLLASLLASSLYAQTVVNVGGLRYLIENNSAIVARQNKDLSGEIVIPSSITYEGNTYAVTSFVDPTNLTAWSSNTVSTEGGAFQDCALTSITIPTSITTISAGCFSGCTQLTKVILPENLENIGAAAFAGCTSLESLSVPKTVKSFGSNSSYGFVSYTFGGCSKLKTIEIPDGVTTIYAGCFKGCGLDSIFIPSNIARLEEDCFSCPNLRVVKMGVSDLSKLSYSSTTFGVVSNTDLYVPKGTIAVYQEYEPWSNFRSIQEYGEDGEVFVPDQINVNIDGIKYILKNNEATISRQNATLSGKIIIPESISYNGQDYPITSMVAPTKLTCYSSNTISCVGGAFQGCQIDTIIIQAGLANISAGAFQNCSSLKKVVLPESTKMLSAACFAGCGNLEDINLPEGLTDLASSTAYGYRSYVFGGCRSLKTMIIPKGVTVLASGCFLNSGIESVSIPSTCTSLDEDCLDASNLKEVRLWVRDMSKLRYTESSFGNVSNAILYVPHGSKQVYQEYYPWMNFSLINEFDDGEPEFVPTQITTRIDGVRYILENGTATVGRQNKDLSGEIVIPSQVTYNGEKYQVTSMVSPTGLTAWSSNRVTTENGAFQSCPITSVTLPSTITTIPAGAFNGCGFLSNINLAEGTTQLGAACFAGCTSLVEIQIPETVNSFGSYTGYGFKSYIFGGCTSLKKVNIPNSVTKFTEGCFMGCGLETFIIPSSVTRLEEDCFSISNLKAIKITHSDLSNLSYTESIFSNVSSVILYVPEGTSAIYKEFYPWKNFKEIIEYKDQNDEFNFNAYSVTYTLPSQSKMSKVRAYSASEANSNIYQKDYIASGVSLKSVENPTIEGYKFMGWKELPQLMPSRDIIIEAIFETATGIEDVKLEKNKKTEVYNLNGIKIATISNLSDLQNLPSGIYIVNNTKYNVKH